ncbi:hypothetical protein E1B28_002455 [Marasmius oreades]|uniref:Neuroguidin n=1 Tax=Marasmius oreades TaxID=181124 RepID=A0A9P7RN28_9AGAR|nr:uncharacterized protein E1B28_002455 [Marasmius oreades]KAG7086502.1 hypothetical protein E1B28_002455 [Marasmius oreades]
MTIEETSQSSSVNAQDACKLLDEMSESMASTRKAIQSLRSKLSESLDTKDGISLLSLKHHVLLSYLHSLVLLSSRRVFGGEGEDEEKGKNGMQERSPPSKSFSDPERDQRGSGMGDMVDQMIEGRLVLEKIKALEGRMKYQIEKLVRISQEKGSEGTDIVNDPLAFRPNPQNLTTNDGDDDDDDEEENQDASASETGKDNVAPSDGIYRPPKIAPTPYLPQSTTTSKSKKERRTGPIPTSLTTLLHASLDGTTPHAESSSGLGGNNPSFNMTSSRARYLKDLTEFEESQFGRVMMGKREANRRARDERDLALGGGLAGVGEDGKGGGRRRRGTAGGFEDEFGDVLRDVGRASRPGAGGGDAYEELRRKGRKAGVLERSRDVHRKRKVTEFEDGGAEAGKRKRSRFESERKNVKNKASRSV